MLEVITNNLDIWTSALLTKSTAGRGSNGKLEAYGVKKLRELILELAVRGKLVPQEPTDVPASALLARVLEENARMLQDKNKKPIEVPQITDGDINFELPQGWEYVRNGSLFSLRKGKKPGNISENQIGLPYLDIEALDRDNILRFTDDDKCPRATEDDILVVCDGSRSGLVLDGKNGVIGSTLAVIDTPRMIQPYIKLLFMEAYERLNSTMKGAAIPHLDTNRLILEIIGLPPLKEQRRIVAKVDELMALCDQLEKQQTNSIEAHQALVEILLGTLTRVESQQELTTAWTRIANHFDSLFATEQSVDQLKQTILQLAVMGKLVAQDPNDEPASVLLEKVAEEKERFIRDGKIKNKNPLPEVNEGEIPFELPAGWEWVRLGKVVRIRGGKRISNGYQLLTTPTSHVYIRVTDMKDGSIDDSDLRYIDDKMYSTISQYIITKDDIYMTIVGATIGKCGLVPDKFDGMNLTENAARLTPYFVSKYYLYKVLSGAFCQDQFIGKTKQVGVQKMALHRLASTIFPLPPLAEQHRIVAKVDELMALCDALKARLADAKIIQIHLGDAIVEQAVA